MADLTEDQLRQIIREEFTGVRTEQTRQVNLLEHIDGKIDKETTEIRAEQATMQANQTGFQAELNSFRDELFRLGVLLEDMDDKLNIVLENLGVSLKLKSKVDVHEERLDDVEAEQSLLKSTIALHSRQLKAA